MLQNIPFFILDWYNRLDYALRQRFHWQRGEISIINESKEDLFAGLSTKQRKSAEDMADRFLHQYHLEHFYAHSRAENYRENLYYLALLERSFTMANIHLGEEIHAADIGVSSWFYVQALYALLRWYDAPDGRLVNLVGYERDAYRVYADFRSRYDHAQTHLQGLAGVSYLPIAFSPQLNHFDILFILFPFLFLRDHLKWGLPKKQFNPIGLLTDAWLSLKKDGVLILVNQGIEEHQVQKHLLKLAAIPIHAMLQFESPLFHYDLERYVIIAIRSD
ncbi:MAG: hypothetical protein ACPL6F_01030 [Anaerolineales bacterium]